MIKSFITLEETINFLNQLVACDQETVTRLIETRVPCSQALADHPTVQVQAYDNQPLVVGILGILNGLFGVDEEGWGAITATFDNNKNLLFFERTQRTIPTNEELQSVLTRWQSFCKKLGASAQQIRNGFRPK